MYELLVGDHPVVVPVHTVYERPHVVIVPRQLLGDEEAGEAAHVLGADVAVHILVEGGEGGGEDECLDQGDVGEGAAGHRPQELGAAPVHLALPAPVLVHQVLASLLVLEFSGGNSNTFALSTNFATSM